jgi:glycogen operon protein
VEPDVIYEAHVKGFTSSTPSVREDLRGTYGGLASEPAIALPQGPRRDRGRAPADPPHRRRELPRRAGLTNYWGYSSIGFLAPARRLRRDRRTGEQVREFKGMVKALHRAGIEVILDVVYNHTAEGNHLGPMLASRRRHKSYYRSSRRPSATTWTSRARATRSTSCTRASCG